MSVVRRFFPLSPRVTCIGLALILTGLLSLHTAATHLQPSTDGQWYALRTFALYGFLHTGQWSACWALFTRPGQSLLTPHDVLFFLVPGPMASAGTYITLQYLATYLALAWGMILVLETLGRPGWAPVIVLLCGVNNVPLIDFYAYHLDMEMFAFGLVAIGFQTRAWKEDKIKSSVLAGGILGLVLFLKPPSALIFFATYVLAEIARAVLCQIGADDFAKRLAIRRDVGGKLLGFMPVALLALFCGANQAILQLIDQNEVNTDVGPVGNGGLLRLLYFPLCLSALYHVTLLILLFSAVTWWSRRERTAAESAGLALPSLGWPLLLPNLIAYIFLGEFFSFWMITKPVRALLLELPFMWIVILWILERCRVRLGPLMFASVCYALVAFGQKEFDLLGTEDQLVENNYQLSWHSWSEMPSPWLASAGDSMAQIWNSVGQNVAPGTVVCLNSLGLKNGLVWYLTQGPRLQGIPPPYEVRNIFNYPGDYRPRSLVGAGAVVIISHPSMLTSRKLWEESLQLIDYGQQAWCGPVPLARRTDLATPAGQPFCTEFIFDRPLEAEEIDRANSAQPLASATRMDEPMFQSLYGRHYSWDEAWALLHSWWAKRFG